MAPLVGIATWLQWVVAVALFLVIAAFGFIVLKALTAPRPSERVEPEDVADLDVFFVCGECGTEFQVTRLGQVQVPRHCGEPMQVVRRPRRQPLDE